MKREKGKLVRIMLVAVGIAMFSLGNLVFSVQSSFAQGKELQKAVIVFGVQTIDPTEGYLFSIPHALGYYREEGLIVELQRVAGGSAAITMLASGRADFASVGTASLFAAVGQGAPVKGFICQIPEYFVSMAVLKSSPINDVKQLKGKVIGVNAVGGGPDLTARALFSSLGMEKDVSYLAVGTGMPAIDALQRGRVDALVLWDTVFAQFEFYGQELRYFHPEQFRKLGFTHTTNALLSTIANKPALVRGLSRAMCKALAFMAAADPAEVTKLHFSAFPESKPGGMSEADVVKMGVYQLRSREPFMQYKERVFDRTVKLGSISKDKIIAYRDLMVSGGNLKSFPPEMYFTDEFIDDMNKFDVDSIIKMARSYKYTP